MSEQHPRLELTDEEKQFCARYATEDLPGVEQRIYRAQLTDTTFPDEVSQLVGRLSPSGRRCRCYQITFTGLLANWRVKLRYQGSRNVIQDFSSVPALLNIAPRFGGLAPPEIGTGLGPSFLLDQVPGRPFRRDPNLLLEGTQELILEGQTIVPAVTVEGVAQRYVLNVAWWCWEFPDVPRRTERAGIEQSDGGEERMSKAIAKKAKGGG